MMNKKKLNKIIGKAEKGIMLQCKRPTCKKKWNYTGKKRPNKNYPINVKCPQCNTSVKLEVKE